MDNYSQLLLLLAAFLDYLIGDPGNWWHPVQGMGWIISRYTHVACKRLQSPLALKLAGVGLAVGLIAGSGLMAWTIAVLAKRIHPIFGLVVESILLASC